MAKTNTNGLNAFAFHELEQGTGSTLKSINESFEKKARNMVTGTVQKPEDVAKFYLMKAMESPEQPLASFSMPSVSDKSVVDFEPFKTEDSPFTKNKMISFRQKINNVCVYGSTVNVELDSNFNLISINSSIAQQLAVGTVAKISPEQARQNAAAYISNEIPESALPMLYIYFVENEWKLVYIIKNVISNRDSHVDNPNDNPHKKYHQHGLINYVNVIVDAETGTVLKESPRSMSAAGIPMPDDYIIPKGQPLQLINEEYNVYTHDLGYKPYDAVGILPGSVVEMKNSKWLPDGVYAHVHGCIVAKFLKDVLKRNGIDNKGMKLISSVQCVEKDGEKEWFNAAWLSGSQQMVYGQVKSNDNFISLAVSLDVVAHEILHGVTNTTSNLDYENQPGALNESYSDIFGIIISNIYSTKDNINANEPVTWNWQLGEDASGVPFRDLSNPKKHGQPDHMQDYQDLPNDRWHDWGGVHINSGIHNKAAYNLLTATNVTSGNYIIPATEVAILFYMTLLQLSNASGFSDSRRSMLNAARSLFKNDADMNPKITAINEAFDAVGIL